MITRMTQKRQVTIAKAICDAEGLAPNMPVSVERLPDGGVVIRAASHTAAVDRRARIEAAIAKWRGTGRDGETTDQFMARIREPLP